jgi:hypothetical protein
MGIILQSEAPPLQRDASGALRVGHSRVLVELVIRAFQDGATPEAIAQRGLGHAQAGVLSRCNLHNQGAGS